MPKIGDHILLNHQQLECVYVKREDTAYYKRPVLGQLNILGGPIYSDYEAHFIGYSGSFEIIYDKKKNIFRTEFKCY